MGDKLKAKELAEKSGVPTLPMTSNTKDVKSIGYPILIKLPLEVVVKECELLKKKVS
jgi:biotin carboxylase